MKVPIDPCGLAVDIGRFAGTADFTFYRDGSYAPAQCFVYFLPPDRPFLPIPHCFLLGGMRNIYSPDHVPEGGIGDDATSFQARWTLPVTWGKVGDHYCGTPEQWLTGSTASDDPLTWTDAGFSTCCEGVYSLGTANTIAKFGADGYSVVDSRFVDDGATITAGTVPVFAAGFAFHNSRITDPGGLNNVRIAAPTECWGGVVLPNLAGTPAMSLIPGTDSGRIQNVWYHRTTGGTRTAEVRIDVGPTTCDFVVGFTGGGISPRFIFGGSVINLAFGSAAYVATTAFDAAGTAASAVSTHEAATDPHPQYLTETEADALYDALGAASTLASSLGTAAYQNTSAFDAAGTASARLPAGVIVPWGGSGSAPSGWLLCDGSAVNRTTYADLFSAIGTTWGAGNGSTTFNVPDLRGRFPVGAGGTLGASTGGTGGALTHTLSQGNLPNVTLAGYFVGQQGTLSWANPAAGSSLNVNNQVSLGGSGTAVTHTPPYGAVQFIIRT